MTILCKNQIGIAGIVHIVVIAMASKQYKKFKQQVKANADGRCETILPSDNVRCPNEGNAPHHFLKQSTYPQAKHDSENGMWCCGSCHSEIERRQREGEDVNSLYPPGRFAHVLQKYGILSSESR